MRECDAAAAGQVLARTCSAWHTHPMIAPSAIAKMLSFIGRWL
ncbi:hypothetical protein AB5I39_16010 [Sphingomonas sp. MMS24-J45]